MTKHNTVIFMVSHTLIVVLSSVGQLVSVLQLKVTISCLNQLLICYNLYKRVYIAIQKTTTCKQFIETSTCTLKNRVLNTSNIVIYLTR